MANANQTNITPNELELLKAIATSEYHTEDLEDREGEPVWTNCMWSHADTAGYGGTMASLSKKGLASSYACSESPDESTCWLTQAGLDIVLADMAAK